ncbi:MAG TPA: NAD(P)-dependent oxidoreductase [Actinomycetes bacterium]|nr:NAD(P)-dependent oxidoreductase [Actinomycetes bacterium]
MQPRETIALLGTGNMGAGMGRTLLRAGFEVRAWNRTAAKAEPLAERGATVAGSPAEAAGGAGILLTMLADGPAVEAAVAAPSGALAALGDSALWVQSSTVGLDDTRRLAGLAAQHGVGFVDAPVLGTRQPAEKGELTVLASGPQAARERCRPLFDAIGSRTLWLGEAGAGTRLKLVVNAWLMGLLGTLASTVALARALGLDPQQFLGTIEGSPIGSAYARLKGDMMVAGDYPTSFSVTLAEKDVRLALEAAAEQGADLPLLRVTDDLFREAIERGLGAADMAAIHEVTRSR